MKRIIVCFLLILLVVGALYCSNNLGVSLDFGTLQDSFVSKDSFQFSCDMRAYVLDGFELRIPIGFAFKKSATDTFTSFLEAGILLVYYPWESGPFMGLSLFQVGFSHGTEDLERLLNLNEVVLGWTFNLSYGLFIEPSVSIRDPSGTFTYEYSKLKGVFSCYRTFRFRLSFGWLFCEV